MIKINKYKENYLIYGAVFIYCTFLIMYYGFFGLEEISKQPTRLDGISNFLFLFISAILFAPIVEEIIFRGVFTKSLLLKTISIIGMPIFIFVYNKEEYLFILAPIVVILIVYQFKPKLINKKIIFSLSAIFFAVTHYKLEQFSNIVTIAPILTQFSMGLVLIWVVINFNLKTSIIVHASYNFLFGLPLFIALSFPDKEIKSLVHDNYKITWSQTFVFNRNINLIKPSNFHMKAENATAISLYEAYGSKNSANIYDSNLFERYNIEIKNINGLPKQKLDSTLLKNILIKSGLIKKKDTTDYSK